MEYRQRQTQARRSGVPERTSRANRNPPPKPDHNELRRKQYANDEGYAERQRELSRNTYRKDNPLAASKLRDGLLAQGTPREVQTDDMEYPTTVEAFTIPEAARALGRTELTLRRWIADDLVPEPILIDTTYHYRQYSAGELRIIAQHIAVHERSFSYYGVAHTTVKEQIMQGVFGFRANSV